MPRKVTLVVYNSRLFRAHWALFIPHAGNNNLGTIVHAEGDSKTGFTTEFKRNYDIAKSSRPKETFPMPEVADEYIVDVKGDGTRSIDYTPQCKLEEIAMAIPAPGKSLRTVEAPEAAEASGAAEASEASEASTPKLNRPTRVKVENCQTWLTKVVELLVEQGVMAPEALEVIRTAPKN